MATLTAPDYKALRRSVYRAGAGKEELKAIVSGVPSSDKLLAAFQALETVWESNRAALKNQIDTALGFTTSPALARKVGLAWLRWKIEQGG